MMMRNLAIQHSFVEQTSDSAGDAVFRGLAFVLMARAGPRVFVFDIRFSHRRQRWAGLITGIAKQIEVFSIGDGHDCSLWQHHVRNAPEIQAIRQSIRARLVPSLRNAPEHCLPLTTEQSKLLKAVPSGTNRPAPALHPLFVKLRT
jgi:hypothetical protein